MKTLIILMLFSFSSWAVNLPQGFYQVNSAMSHIVWKGHQEKVSGLVEFKKEFKESVLKFESLETSFESEEIIGDLENFQVKGVVQYKGKDYPLTFNGKYFGSTSNHIGDQKIAVKLSHEKLQIVLFASRPAENTSALYKEVQDIVQ